MPCAYSTKCVGRAFIVCGRSRLAATALNVVPVLAPSLHAAAAVCCRCTKNFLVYYNPDTKEWIRCAPQPWSSCTVCGYKAKKWECAAARPGGSRLY